MTDKKLTKAFTEETTPPALMSPAEYQSTLEKLLGDGEGRGKTVDVGAFLLEDIKLVTETSSGKDETAKDIKVEKLYIVMDTSQYPSDYLRGLVVQDITKNWGGKLIKERDLDSPDFKGPGIWTIKQNSFEFDYVKPEDADAKSSTYVPNTEAYRVCLTVDDAVTIPVQWGDFTVEAGGTLAIRERDVPALAGALMAIRHGEMTPEEALYETKEDGSTVAKFDIYGMEPGFLEGNYGKVELKEATQAIQSKFKDGEDGPKAQADVARPKKRGFSR